MEGKASSQIVKTFCGRMCTGGCGILVWVEDGRAVKIKGDPDYPLSKGFLCPKGLASLEILYHPDRLKHPQQRIGGRGEGKWQQIPWDEALGIIAERLRDIKGRSGAQSIVLGLGTPKGLELPFAHRLASVFGVVNIITPGPVCHLPRELASTFTYGTLASADYEHFPRCILVWGSNPLETNEGGVTRAQFRPALDKGAKLIVIDPREINLTSRADLWLKPRPGSDGALALGMIKVIIDEKLWDKDFVDEWTVGFDQLKEHIRDYPLNKVEEITWLSKEQIEAAARLYATTKPAVIQWGNALEHNSNSFQTCRAIAILRAIIGNLDIPGGDILPTMPSIMRPAELMLLKKFPREPGKMVNSQFKLAARSLLVPSQLVVKAILEGEPYPVKAALLIGSNPLLTYADAQRTFDALKKLEFLVVSEFFMTPTAELADIVLPAAANLELDDIGHYVSRWGFIQARSKVVEPPGECWADIKIINELAKKLGLGEYFWADVKEAFDSILKPCGLTFDELKKIGTLWGDKEYKKYEGGGFRTPSGKVEIYSQQLQELGYEPLPVYNDPAETPCSRPDLVKEYPLIFTSAKSPTFPHSGGKNIASLRRLSPEPVVEINTATAAELGIKEGDWVYIETKRGKIKQKASLKAEIDPRVVIAAYGWWFPEKGVAQLYGWKESNINVLTESSSPYDPFLGSTNLRGMLCKVSRA